MFSLIPRRKRQQQEQPLARLRDEFESVLDRFLGRRGSESDSDFELGLFSNLDVDDRDDEIVVRADLPGFEPSEIDTQLSGNVLTIKAEKEQKQEHKKGNGNGREERTYRYFYESLTLPEGVKADGIDAKFRNGVLEIHVPKSEQAQAKRIPVNG